jgi:phenylpropionate dioxygenase-like ring-hydroxylating dioxygenase large terminal subunit
VSAGISWPDDDGVSRTPYGVHADAELFAREQVRIFRGPTWHFLAMEAQLPGPGCFVRARIGDTPILVTRDTEGAFHAMVNRCSHRGAPLVLAEQGKLPRLTCFHHQWCYDLDGRLRSVTHERGQRGQGGMPADFDKARHGLPRLRIHRMAGLIFGTLSEDAPAFEAYAGPEILAGVTRVAGRAPLVVLGEIRQLVHANWKLCAEGLRDAYHARLLHRFNATMKIEQPTMHGGGTPCGPDGGHYLAVTYGDIDPHGAAVETSAGFGAADFSAFGKGLRDTEMTQVWDDHGDGLLVTIQGLFPTFAQQQRRNALAIGTLVPLAPDRTELRWIFFGYADDDAGRRRGRLKQANLMGPAGLNTMDDATACEAIQRGIGAAPVGHALLRMGGDGTGPTVPTRASEAGPRGFWAAYRALMGL